MAKTLTFSMAIDIQRVEVLLPNDRRSITIKTNVNRTNKPSTNAGHLHASNIVASIPNVFPRTSPASANCVSTQRNTSPCVSTSIRRRVRDKVE